MSVTSADDKRPGPCYRPLMMQSSPDRYQALALLALLCGAIGIGFAPILVRLSDVGPVSSAFWRMTLSVPFLLLVLRFVPRRAVAAPARPALLILCGLFFAADLGLWHWSIALTTIANATLFANISPVFVALAGFLLFGERFTRLFLVGLALAMGGALLLVGGDFSIGGRKTLGDLLGIATAVMYAGYFLCAKRLRAGYSALEVLTLTAVVTALALLPAALLGGETLLPASARGWLVLFALALLSQILGQGLILWALAHLPVAFSALALLLQPVVAALLAWQMFGERPGLTEALGGLLILAGIAFARFGSRPSPEKPA
ncbi:MAG: DMT family transporter [Rhodothalassiaceae bacterium]